MLNRYFVVVDAGTSRMRCSMFDESGEPLCTTASDWRYAITKDGPMLAREFDPDWLAAELRELIARCIGTSGVARREIVAVSVTSQRQALAFLSQGDNTLYVGPNTDLRAVFEGGAIDEEMGDSVYETTGHLPSLLLAPAKLKWFEANRPEGYARISRVLTLADWIVWNLTGEPASEVTLAGEAGLIALRERTWCESLLADLRLPQPGVPLVRSGTVVGTVTAEAAATTGLPADTPVVAAGADTQCGLLGLGISEEGGAGVVAGWSVPIQITTNRPVLSPAHKTWAGCWLDPALWVLESTAGDAGNSYRWLSCLLFGREAFDEMDALAGSAPVGSDGATALLGPSRMDVSRLGMSQGGLHFPVPLAVSDLGRPQIVRSAIEAVAYAVRSNLEQAEEVAGVRALQISVGGGMTRSKTFVRVLADVLGREVFLSTEPGASAAGAYLCARTGVGDFDSLGEATASGMPRLRSVEPDPLGSAEYDGLYQHWTELSGQIEALGL
ncbi:MAG: FGGY-family carbohydrate kinase [Chloroflexi bacterium]|nr:FGGY-family carbohydrate kinase [Chloroflexota bacterium]